MHINLLLKLLLVFIPGQRAFSENSKNMLFIFLSLSVLFKFQSVTLNMNMIDAMKDRLHYIRRFNIIADYSIDFFFSGNVLDSCDGRVVSNNNIYVDFGVIKYQCSCSFKNALNAHLIYTLSRNPGYEGCGTAIQIKEINDNIYKIPCSSITSYISSQLSTVELVCSDSTICDNAGICLRILPISMFFYNLIFKLFI